MQKADTSSPIDSRLAHRARPAPPQSMTQIKNRPLASSRDNRAEFQGKAMTIYIHIKRLCRLQARKQGELQAYQP